MVRPVASWFALYPGSRWLTRGGEAGTGSVLERLAAREQAAAGRIEEIRQRIAVLAAELGEAKQELERLRIGRQVLAEVLAEDEPARPEGSASLHCPADAGSTDWTLVAAVYTGWCALAIAAQFWRFR